MLPPPLPPYFIHRRIFRLHWALLLTCLLPAAQVTAQVRLNEIVAATNDRLLMADEQGRLRPGTGPFWGDLNYTAPGWLTGTAPLGFGGAAGLGTNVAALMQNRSPTLYLRRTLTLTPEEVANEGQLRLRVRFDDGFIAWINGREVARANAGPAGHFIYAGQKAYNFAVSTNNTAYTPNSQPGTAAAAPGTGITYPLGRVSDFLQAGQNILAVQLLNREPNVSARIDAQLEVIQANAVLDVLRYTFDDANNAAEVHRNQNGTVTNTVEGTIPAGSWLDLAARAQSGPGWNDLTLRSALVSGAGYENTGALRYSYSQTDAANQPASVSGPALSLASQIPAGGLTLQDLDNLRVNFRFRATPNTAWNVRLDPDGNNPGASLTGLAAITPTAGTGVTQDASDGFDDALNGLRTRTVNPAGAATTVTTGTIRNSLNFVIGPALRDGIFTLRETNAPGTGTGAAPGALEFEVAQAPAVFDFFGFTYQSVIVRSWTASAVTPAQLGTGALQFDYQLPAGVTFNVFLESASGSPTAGDRLGLGTLTGTGGWQTATLDTSSGTNQSAFITYLNSVSTNSVRVVFRSEVPLPAGSRMSVDNVGYFPWRTYNVAFATGGNQTAFLDAINTQTSPQVVPVFEKTGIAAAPSSAVLTIDDFALTLTKTNAGTATVMVPFAAPNWNYYPGLAEPSGGVVEPADFNIPGGTGDYADWIELFNPGASPVDLSDWSLTDSASDPRRFVFPSGTVLAAGAALVVVADSRPAPAGAAWLHAPFSLSSGGEYVALVSPSGAVVDSLDPGYPAQTPFYSWGRDPATHAWGFMRTATPGQPNAGSWQPGIAAEPVFGVTGGFYPAAVSVPLTTSTPGAVIRYTTDGSDPTLTTGQLYTGNLSLGFISDRIGHVIKARSYADGLLPSPVVTHTYLINQNANLRTAPAVLMSGDPGQTFYKPLGIMAIQGGVYNNSQWTANGPNAYNMPMGDGRLTDPDSSSRPYERPIFMEYYFADNRPGLRENAGVRISSSPYSRPRLILDSTPNSTLWPADATRKPSFNIFFRNDYGNNSINYPLIPETEVRDFTEFRLRAGKNDISNPFIRDEFIRRLWTDMGQEGTVGTFTTVYLNGYFKGFYNLVERIREAFMQNHYRSSAEWDVNYINVFEDGDNVHWNTVLQPRLNANLTVKANWDALREVLDVTNVADYILLNAYTAMWDWPHNNWAMARERSATGIWRCYVWDAEGGYSLYGNKGTTWQTLRDDLLGSDDNTPVPVMFKRLMTSPEFRLLFADRIQQHLFNKGALTDARTGPRRAATQAEVAPLMAVQGITPDVSWYNNWIHPTTGRRATLFPGTNHGQFRDPNQDGNLSDTLWPLTLPPVFNQHGGTVSAGFTLTVTHNAPAGSVVYYTLDGSDPRNWGNTVAAAALTYSAPIALPASSTTVKARVRNATTNEWSPLTEARFALATVPASAANTVISEVMYHPPPLTTAEAAAGFVDAEDFEYIVLQNIGTAPIDITILRMQLGVTFNFDTSLRPVIDPGQRAVLAKNANALRFRYGAGIDAVLAGEYFGNLVNSGETVRLEVTSNATPVKEFTYDDSAPWPSAADGKGSSLRLVNPASNPDHNLAVSWTASAAIGGSPTGQALNQSYSQWAYWSFSTNQLNDPVRTGPEGDFDRDGLPNLIEFLMGQNPRQAIPLQWTVTPGPGGTQVLRVSLPRLTALTGYLMEVQSSADLQVWQADFTMVSSTPQADGTTLQVWEKTVPAGTAGHYLRLKAVPVP